MLIDPVCGKRMSLAKNCRNMFNRVWLEWKKMLFTPLFGSPKRLGHLLEGFSQPQQASKRPTEPTLRAFLPSLALQH